MKKRIGLLSLLILLSSVSFVGVSLAADDGTQNAARSATSVSKRISVRDMTAEQRKETWSRLSPDQQQRIIQKRESDAARKARWTNLTPEAKRKAEIAKQQAFSSGAVLGQLPEAEREKIQSSTPEDKVISKGEVLMKWRQLSPDEKEMMLAGAKKKWNTLTSEEQDQMRLLFKYEKLRHESEGDGVSTTSTTSGNSSDDTSTSGGANTDNTTYGSYGDYSEVDIENGRAYSDDDTSVTSDMKYGDAKPVQVKPAVLPKPRTAIGFAPKNKPNTGLTYQDSGYKNHGTSLGKRGQMKIAPAESDTGKPPESYSSFGPGGVLVR